MDTLFSSALSYGMSDVKFAVFHKCCTTFGYFCLTSQSTGHGWLQRPSKSNE